MVYQDAFKGISADVVYTITQATFEQDVLIKERVDPSQWGFDPATARIRIFTELFDAPRPERMRRPIRVETDERVRARMVTPDLVDEVLGFGEFVLSTGRTFRSAEDETPLLVAKETLVAENRAFLVESLEFAPLKEVFETLPPRRSASLEKRSPSPSSRRDDLLAILPSSRPSAPAAAKPRARDIQLAKARAKRPPGLVIDYIATIGGTLSGTTVFQAYTTYFVSAPVNCNGATTIENAVFKFKYVTASPYPSITLNNTFTCKTSPYHPAIFTAVDDDSVGDSLNGCDARSKKFFVGSGSAAVCYRRADFWKPFELHSRVFNHPDGCQGVDRHIVLCKSPLPRLDLRQRGSSAVSRLIVVWLVQWILHIRCDRAIWQFSTPGPFITFSLPIRTGRIPLFGSCAGHLPWHS